MAWNIPGHMLSAAIAYQVLRQENRQIIDTVKALLEKHPWYANQWQARLQDVPVGDRDIVLFMQAARWADGRTSSITMDPGITSTYHSNPRDNRTACKSDNPSQ